MKTISHVPVVVSPVSVSSESTNQHLNFILIPYSSHIFVRRFPLKERRRSTIERSPDPFFIGIAADREPTLVSRANESSGSDCIVQREPLRATQRKRGSRRLVGSDTPC